MLRKRTFAPLFTTNHGLSCPSPASAATPPDSTTAFPESSCVRNLTFHLGSSSTRDALPSGALHSSLHFAPPAAAAHSGTSRQKRFA